MSSLTLNGRIVEDYVVCVRLRRRVGVIRKWSCSSERRVVGIEGYEVEASIEEIGARVCHG